MIKTITVLFCILFFSSTWSYEVNPVNGNFFFNLNLIQDGDFKELKVSYNSKFLLRRSLLGIGWGTILNNRLIYTDSNHLYIVEKGQGKPIVFKTKNSFSMEKIRSKAAVTKAIKGLGSVKNPKDINTFLLHPGETIRPNESAPKGKVSFENINGTSESVTFDKGVYVRSLPDGSVQEYNQKGLLNRIKRNGSTINITYKQDMPVELSYGKYKIELNYEKGRLVSGVYKKKQIFLFTYNDDYISKVSFADRGSVYFTYKQLNGLKVIDTIRANGSKVVDLKYDSLANVVESRINGRHQKYTYKKEKEKLETTITTIDLNGKTLNKDTLSYDLDHSKDGVFHSKLQRKKGSRIYFKNPNCPTNATEKRTGKFSEKFVHNKNCQTVKYVATYLGKNIKIFDYSYSGSNPIPTKIVADKKVTYYLKFNKEEKLIGVSNSLKDSLTFNYRKSDLKGFSFTSKIGKVSVDTNPPNIKKLQKLSKNQARAYERAKILIQQVKTASNALGEELLSL